MVNMRDSKSCAEKHAGSSPVEGKRIKFSLFNKKLRMSAECKKKN